MLTGGTVEEVRVLGFPRRHPSIKLNVLIYHKGDEWVAHCLQMDIVTTAPTQRAAEHDILDLIKAQVIFALENDNIGHLFKPAPDEEWAKLEQARHCAIRKIRIQMPRGDGTAVRRRPPIKEVELCVA